MQQKNQEIKCVAFLLCFFLSFWSCSQKPCCCSKLCKRNVYNNVSLSGPFPCEICGRQFNDTGNRKRHIECTHGGKRKWTCFICGKSVRERYVSVPILSSRFPSRPSCLAAETLNSLHLYLQILSWCVFLLAGRLWGSTCVSTVGRNLTCVASVGRVFVTAAPIGGSRKIWRHLSVLLTVSLLESPKMSNLFRGQAPPESPPWWQTLWVWRMWENLHTPWSPHQTSENTLW